MTYFTISPVRNYPKFQKIEILMYLLRCPVNFTNLYCKGLLNSHDTTFSHLSSPAFSSGHSKRAGVPNKGGAQVTLHLRKIWRHLKPLCWGPFLKDICLLPEKTLVFEDLSLLIRVRAEMISFLNCHREIPLFLFYRDRLWKIITHFQL